MSKIWIILKSEFLRRVTSKWFIIITLLAPVLLVALLFIPGLVTVIASGGDETTVAVIDETGVLLPRLQAEAGDDFTFTASELSQEALRDSVMAGAVDGYLYLPPQVLDGEGGATYYSAEGGGLSFGMRLTRTVSDAVEQERLQAQQVPDEVLQIIETNVDVDLVKLTEEGEEEDATLAYTIVGYVMGFFIYMSVFIYGAIVMQGVIEEKTSRVVEVVVSSVRPFQLLMGKVLGIGAMGLVQLITWAALIGVGMTFAGTIMALFLNPADLGLSADASQQAMLEAADITIPSVPPGLFIWFILFFLGGYLLYASLYAAIGSAVEQQQDAQTLQLPIALLVIVPILFIGFIVESPNSTLSVVMSLIPFFAPILMIVRVAVTDVAFWQVGLSYLLLIGTFIGSIWISSRIYRIGILMYGKKPSLKDLAKWVRYA
ncbi:MAG: ABC transporter permease [Bacteroidetes bacterium]|jgi:ABC-2 type transport system permease protein|nr:ABC transporter permease [Bacteroidota bacterium]